MAAMTVPEPAPPVDPRELRPGRAWYAVAAVIALLGVCAFPVLIALGVNSFGSLKPPDPHIRAEFGGGAAASVALTADRTWAIYSAPATAAPRTSLSCTATGPGAVDLAPVTASITVTVNGRSWQELYTFKVGQDGDYRFTCEASDPSAAPVGYAVGEEPDIGGFLAGLFGGFGAIVGAILLPCGGLLLGGLVALAVALLRTSHRRGLERARAGAARPAPPD
jgi:hypothetical protein